MGTNVGGGRPGPKSPGGGGGPPPGGPPGGGMSLAFQILFNEHVSSQWLIAYHHVWPWSGLVGPTAVPASSYWR